MKVRFFILRTASGLFLALSAVLLLVSCQNDDEDIPQYANRVLLVYMGGDNNLSNELYEKLDAISEGWNTNGDDKLLLYLDAADRNPFLIELVDRGGVNTQKVVKSYVEENSAESKTLSHVIATVKQLYPANSYGLLVFSHGSGWLPEGMLNKPKSIIVDNKAEMEIQDFANAIPDKMFDYIIFEACFMAGIETAYELQNKADYILASSAEIVSPGFTPIYSESIDFLFEKNTNTVNFAKAVFNYFGNQNGYKNSATFSVIKTSELEPLAAFVKKNCDFRKEVDIMEIQYFDRYSYHLFFDFEDYYSALLETEAQKQELIELINNAVIYKAATVSFMPEYDGFVINKHSGMTTYIKQQRFPFLNEKYAAMKWNQRISK